MLISRLKSGLGMLWKSHLGSHVCVCVHKRAMGSLWASAPIGQDQAHLRGRIIKTLDPTKFSSSGQNYFSFSDRHALMVVVNTNDGRVQYIRIRYCYQENFPKSTRGFLYYYTPPPGDSAMSGSLRFRITNDSDPSDFSNGVDLRFPDGRPWQIFLHSMATQPAYALLVEKALADGLVTKEVVERIKEHKRLPRTMFNLSNSLHEPFTVSVNARYKSLSFTVDDKIETEVVKLPFVEKRRHLREVMPYQGEILARFERSKLPEHVNTRTLVLRILKLKTPIKCVIPMYDHFVALPTAGKLMSKGKRVWSINLDKPQMPYSTLNKLWSKED